ncbi:GYF domain-containing protein [Humisphaera borealis]|uniref:DUF4339 domain-containing protein n=1 Tax=Humisphaera borealis TaxID=2807512 RepID=A0A7M2WRA1_9BACT|nr:GYF domain-containing protein [Humisphaera borealis]QOV87774.1 DUF4339 domain-containing protein [Humisphaera borealis]
MQYYYADGDDQKGPVDLNGLRSAGISRQTLVWREGLGEWQPAGQVTELAALFAGPPEATPFVPPAPPQPLAGPAYPQAAAYPAQPTPPQAQVYGVPGGYPPGAFPPAGQPHNLAYGGYPQQAGYPQGYVAPSSQGMSIASLVLGILAIPSTFCYGFGFLLALLAVIFGHIGHSQSKKQTGRANGMAVAGLVCGYISLAVVAALFIFLVALVNAATYGR